MNEPRHTDTREFDRKRITHQFMQSVQISESRFDRVLVPALMMIGIIYTAWQALAGDWLETIVMGIGVALLVALAASRWLQMRVLGMAFNRRHALYVVMLWVYLILFINFLRLLPLTSPTGKNSSAYWALVIGLAAIGWMIVRTLTIFTRRGYRLFITKIPIWEQILVALNEFIAIGLLAVFGGNLLVRLFQPSVFTTRFDALYTISLGGAILLYCFGMQMMWVARWNDWLSQNRVWVRIARLFAPFVFLVGVLIIARRVVERSDPRSASLLGDSASNMAILAVAPVILLVIGVVTFLVYTSNRGLRQRFLPDALLEKLPARLGKFLSTVSDMDMLLILALMATAIPTNLFLLGDARGVIGSLRQQILQRASSLIETSEQALALLFALPFYLLIIILLILYAIVIARQTLSAQEREELVSRLPIGFLIILIITLYLFAVPFRQVLTEGRLPQLPQDLGRILAFNIIIPLALLYAHYFVLVRIPYRRGQGRWRNDHHVNLAVQLDNLERRIEQVNREIEQLDRSWHLGASIHGASAENSMDILYRYVKLNSLRDDLNMRRLQLVAERQQLAEISEAPISMDVARLPVRIVTYGIPLLFIIQFYQWAIINNGLREIVNNPNITILDFFRAILQNFNF